MTINRPDIENQSDPHPLGPLAGNYSDDDGLALDEYFESADSGPQQPKGVAPQPEKELAPDTRIVSASAPVGTSGGVLRDPVMLFPPDKKRKVLCLISTGGAFTFASQKSDCYNGAASLAIVLPAATLLTIPSHTGPVWVYSTDATAVTVSGWTVTE